MGAGKTSLLARNCLSGLANRVTVLALLLLIFIEEFKTKSISSPSKSYRRWARNPNSTGRRDGVGVEFFEGWKPFSPLQLAVEEVLYPSTHGVCEEGIDEICKIIHANGVRMERITIDEYLAMKDKKMAKQCLNSSFEKLWCLADEDDEEESYTFDTHEFLAIQIHDNLSSKFAWTGESLYSTLNERYDIADDLFTYDTPLGIIFDEFGRLSSMEDDLCTYEVGILKPSYFPYVKQRYNDLVNGNLDVYEPQKCYDEYERMFAEAIILIDDRLVKLIDITLEQWKQIEEYTEIKRRLEVNGINTDVEYDPTNVKFPKWLASKFNNHKTIDWYTKNALWLYWKRGDDEEILTYDEFLDPEEENLREDTEITEIFRIETDIFIFETPLCTEFKEFNHLIQFDIDVLTRDLPGFKTYEDYKNS
ncbi:hypothetical protein Tco_0647692 [Tanacetum coccineum]